MTRSEPPSLLIELGQLLRRARLDAGLSQEEVADRAGIARQNYREIENGAAAARVTTLANVARSLGMEMMLVPQPVVPAVKALLDPAPDDDRPAYAPDQDDGDDLPAPRR